MVRRPITASTIETNSAKLSAWTTPKPVALRFHSRPAASAAPTRPITPSPPMGIRSSFRLNASASIVAMAVSVTRSIGMMAWRFSI